MRTMGIGFILSLVGAKALSDDIPDWYKQDLASNIAGADSVVLFRIDSISLSSSIGHHFVYRFDTTTLDVLKGAASPNACYFFQTEGEWDHSDRLGEVRLAILAYPENEGCRLIEPGYSAPGTDEYLQLFKSAIGDF